MSKKIEDLQTKQESEIIEVNSEIEKTEFLFTNSGVKLTVDVEGGFCSVITFSISFEILVISSVFDTYFLVNIGSITFSLFVDGCL